jgi:dTDP-4-amino-4,6-dideoxygalactose transaminase
MRIPIAKPYFDNREKKALSDVLDSGWVVQGPRVAEFENIICSYTGSKYAKAVTSCTTALHLALIACGIGRGDEVIVPSFTYIATANSVEYVGARPVFIDIDLATFNIDVSKIEDKISKKTKAIIPVHLFGLCADMDPILKLAKKYKLKVIEDAACVLGGWYKGRHGGTMGDCGCLSFHPRKSITTGEGGMLLTNNREIAEKVEALRNHGAEVSDLARHKKGGFLLPEFNMLGFNYRMTEFQGAIGVEQMNKFPEILEAKRELAAYYDYNLPDSLIPPNVPSRYLHGYQAYVCLFSGVKHPSLKKQNKKRNEMMALLEKEGISTRQGTHAVHALGYYRKKYNILAEDFPNSLKAEYLSMALPLYKGMGKTEQEYIIGKINRICAE